MAKLAWQQTTVGPGSPVNFTSDHQTYANACSGANQHEIA